MQISKQVIHQIKEQLDIVQIVGEYVPTLKRAGKNWSGLCPFHNEKRPSFSVAIDYGIYKCFSCGESGDIISFVQKIEGLTFNEAVLLLAKRAGIELELSDDAGHYKKREDFVSFNNRLAGLFQYFLVSKQEGQRALSYLQDRGISKDIIDTFKIGYAPREYGRLERLLVGKGFKKQFLAESGIFKGHENSLKTMFFDRIMFPIYNHRNECVGFGGRILSGEGGPKYLNTPETILYKKSYNLYGIHTAKEAIKREKKVFIVEGYFDVVACYMNKVENVVAPCGTAITKEQIKLLSRFTQSITLLLDGDDAGAKGAIKALYESANIQNVQLEVLELPRGTDPDDFFKSNDYEAFKEYEKQSRSAFDYMVLYYTRDIDLKEYTQLMQALDALFEYIKLWESDLIKNSLLDKVSEILSIEKGVLTKEFASYTQRGYKKRKPEPQEPKQSQPEVKQEKVEEKIKEIVNEHTTSELELLVYLYKYQESPALIKQCGLMKKFFLSPQMARLFEQSLEGGFKEKSLLTDYIDSSTNHILKEHFNNFVFTLEKIELLDRHLIINIVDRIKEIKKHFYEDKNRELKEKQRLAEMYMDSDLISEIMEEKYLNILEIKKLSALDVLKRDGE